MNNSGGTISAHENENSHVKIKNNLAPGLDNGALIEGHLESVEWPAPVIGAVPGRTSRDG